VIGLVTGFGVIKMVLITVVKHVPPVIVSVTLTVPEPGVVHRTPTWFVF
jgi:hypothetical protein